MDNGDGELGDFTPLTPASMGVEQTKREKIHVTKKMKMKITN